MLAFPCPKCKATLKASEEMVGASSKCPHCGNAVQVPKPTVPVPPARTLGTAASPARTPSPSALLASGKWFALVLAMILALAAVALPLAGYGGGVLSYGTAGGAIVVALAAVWLTIVARRSMLECAV